jgi:hypothetical protein
MDEQDDIGTLAGEPDARTIALIRADEQPRGARTADREADRDVVQPGIE